MCSFQATGWPWLHILFRRLVWSAHPSMPHLTSRSCSDCTSHTQSVESPEPSPTLSSLIFIPSSGCTYYMDPQPHQSCRSQPQGWLMVTKPLQQSSLVTPQDPRRLASYPLSMPSPVSQRVPETSPTYAIPNPSWTRSLYVRPVWGSLEFRIRHMSPHTQVSLPKHK